MVHNLLSSNEISVLLNIPIVKINKEKLSTLQKVDFSLQVSETIKNKLENGLGIHLSETIPMRWIKGDTAPHTDKGEKNFNNTYLVYLTDSIGNLIIDGQTYPIAAGDAHIFSEGVEHSTLNTGNSERLMIGPMSESGFRVGLPPTVFYYNNRTDATNDVNSIGDSFYELITIDTISEWVVFNNIGGTNPSPNGGPYNVPFTLIATGTYRVYPYIPPPPPRFSMFSLFTNNAQVFYKSHSLSTGSGGSGVRNSRHKQRRT
jgi:hypothetical protein